MPTFIYGLIPDFLHLTMWCVPCKGETITRVNGNVSFFASKRLQNF